MIWTRSGRPPGQRRRPPWRVEGAENRGEQGRDQPAGGNGWSRFWWLWLVLLAGNWIVASVMLAPEPRATVSYTFFLEQVGATNVASVDSTGETIQGDLKSPVSYAPPPGGGPGEQVTRFTTERPTFADDNLFQQLQGAGVPVNASPPDTGAPLWQQLLLGFGPALLLVWLLLSVGRRAGGGAGGALGSFGRSRAALYRPESGPRTTFADVAGIDEAKSEVTEIVDFLSDPEKYRRLGAQDPQGRPALRPARHRQDPAGQGRRRRGRRAVLLHLRVGVHRDDRRRRRQPGARPVRPRPRRSPRRSSSSTSSTPSAGPAAARVFGGHDEREQTLNQILTEMDGFTGTEGVIVIAATNRPEMLDPALLRPGRFDRRVIVSPPDLNGRPRDPRGPHPRRPAGPRRRPRRHRRGDARAWSAPTWPTWSTRPPCSPPGAAATRSARRDFADALEKIVLGTVRAAS